MPFGVMRTRHAVSTRTSDDFAGLTDITVCVEEEFGQTEEDIGGPAELLVNYHLYV